MSRQITQPVNQVRLTNVAVVRMQTHGKRFEIACYRNKIVNYRQGIETDLEETLQTDRVFTNVSKGQFAPSSDLKKAFGTTDEEEICKIILMKGQVQVSDMERSAQLEATTKEVASMLAAKCVDPSSNRPYTVSQIRDAMQRAEFCVHPTRNVKQQFLDCVKLIKSKGVLPIQRAQMELCVVCDASREDDVEGALKEAGVQSDVDVNVDVNGDIARLVILIDPSLFRAVDTIAKDATICGSSGRLEILQQCVTAEGDVNLASEMERKNELSRKTEMTRAKTEKECGSDDDDNVSKLANKVGRVMSIKDDDDSEDATKGFARPVSARKSNKKAQKKSKKARRRGKEEAAERQARIDAEKARQAERAARLGLDENVPSTNAENSYGAGGAGGASTKSCNTCGGSFTAAQYRAHFRGDWHRYNMKLKMSGASPVSEDEFKLCDSDAFFD